MGLTDNRSKCLTLVVASKFAFAFIKASAIAGDSEYRATIIRGDKPFFNEHTCGQ